MANKFINILNEGEKGTVWVAIDHIAIYGTIDQSKPKKRQSALSMIVLTNGIQFEVDETVEQIKGKLKQARKGEQ